MTWFKTRILVLIAAGTLVLGPAAVLAGAHSKPHHHTRRHHTSIPQHNGGDHDADNNGAPSDGDGNQ